MPAMSPVLPHQPPERPLVLAAAHEWPGTRSTVRTGRSGCRRTVLNAIGRSLTHAREGPAALAFGSCGTGGSGPRRRGSGPKSHTADDSLPPEAGAASVSPKGGGNGNLELPPGTPEAGAARRIAGLPTVRRAARSTGKRACTRLRMPSAPIRRGISGRIRNRRSGKATPMTPTRIAGCSRIVHYKQFVCIVLYSVLRLQTKGRPWRRIADFGGKPICSRSREEASCKGLAWPQEQR